MQVTQTLSEGLKREFQVVVSIDDLEKRVASELETMKAKANIPGFRPGKVPTTHLRRLYGKQVMADVVEKTVSEANKKIVEDNSLRLALEPRVKLPEDQGEVEKILAGKADLQLSVALEVLPKFEVADHGDITLEQEVVPVADADIDEAISRMATQFRPFNDKPGQATAETGDKVLIDFVGKKDGEAFEGGSAEGHELVLGSGQFIPGFEEQLVGAKVDDEKMISVSFPDDYNAEHLAGKRVTFDVTVRGIQTPGEVVIDDALAKQFGVEDLAALRTAIHDAIERDYKTAARRKVKRKLLDALDAKYDFELPPTLLVQEMNNIWMQVEAEMKESGKTFEDEGTTEEKAKADYEKIAQRRVRLGLVLAEIGETAKIEITDDEVSKALVERAKQFPGQEKAVWDYYRNNPQALAEIRAPIFEDKVVDQILAQVKLTDKTVTKADLMSEDGEEAETGAGKKPAKAKAVKKAKNADDAGAGETKAGDTKADDAEADTAEAAPKPEKKTKAKKAEA